MFDYANAIARCDDNSIKVILKKIEHYKEYSLLCTATGMEYKKFREMFDTIPASIRAWYKFTNGGLLFDTMLLSTQSLDMTNGVRLGSLRMYNAQIVHKMTELPQDLVVFAVASFGDYYCFSQSGSNEIVQWSVAEHKAVAKWSSFSIWLNQEVNAAIELITDEVLLPLGIHSERR